MEASPKMLKVGRVESKREAIRASPRTFVKPSLIIISSLYNSVPVPLTTANVT